MLTPKPKLTPGDEGYDWNTYTPDTSVDDAKSFLAASDAQDITGSLAADKAEKRLAILSANHPRTDHGTMRQLTDAGEAIALPMMGASMLPTPAKPAFAAGSAALYGAAGLRKLLAPEEDESRWTGALDVGLSAIPYGKQMWQGIKGAVTGSNLVKHAATARTASQQIDLPFWKSSAKPSMEPSFPHGYATPKPVPLQSLRDAAARDAKTSEIMNEGHGAFGNGGIQVGPDMGPSERLIPRSGDAPLQARMRELYGPSQAERNAMAASESAVPGQNVGRALSPEYTEGNKVAERVRANRDRRSAPRESSDRRINDPEDTPISPGGPELPESWNQWVKPEEKLAKLSKPKTKRPSRARKVA